MTPVPIPVEPETKDWTFALDRGCPDCRFDPATVAPPDVGPRLRATIPRWTAVLAGDAARSRPQPTVWSPAEYACPGPGHVPEHHLVDVGG